MVVLAATWLWMLRALPLGKSTGWRDGGRQRCGPAHRCSWGGNAWRAQASRGPVEAGCRCRPWGRTSRSENPTAAAEQSGNGYGVRVLSDQGWRWIACTILAAMVLAAPLLGLVCTSTLPALKVVSWHGAFSNGQRIGEAARPGPLDTCDAYGKYLAACHTDGQENRGSLRSNDHCCLDDPDLDPFVDLDRELDHTPEFETACKFTGARAGRVFKLGCRGLGYYKDRGCAMAPTEETSETPCEFVYSSQGLPHVGHRQLRAEAAPWHALQANDLREPHLATAEDESEEEVVLIEGRRRRRRRRDVWLLESVNSTCERSARARLRKTLADVVCVQEHHQLADQLDEVRRLSGRAGWKAAYDSALHTTGKGSSGGTGIAVREWVGIREADALPTDVEWPPQHRFSLRWVDVVVKGGILVGSVYLETGAGYGGANIGILNMIGQVLRAYGRPFILGGDWQMDRTTLEASGWLRAVGGTVLAPSEGEFTCISSSSASTIDYFVVVDALLPAVRRIYVDSDCTEIRTHHPVQLEIAGTARSNMVQRYRRPCAFPVQRPVGCDPRPPDYQRAVDALNAATTAQELNEGFVQWIQSAEQELVGRYGLQDQRRYLGRGQAYRVVKVAMCGSRGNGQPKANGEATMYRWLGDRLQELGHLWYGEQAPSSARIQHGWHIVRRLQLYKCPFADPPALWASWCEFRPWLASVSLEALQQAAGLFHSSAKRIEQAEASQRAAGWKNWAAVTAMADGARLGHRWTKPVAPWIQSEVTADGSMETAQAAADRKAGEWHHWWGVCEDLPTLAWDDMPACDELELPSVLELRETGRSFSRFTALGSDDLHPKHVSTLSDESLLAFIALIAAMLRLYQVPQAIALLLVILLPKPEGGTRPIGLFPTVVRVWARWARKKYAVPWEEKNRRSYWFGERGKSCDMCTWRQALSAEYATATDQHAVSALLDLHKAYEHVRHQYLQAQAVQYGFNWKLLRFLLALYSMNRVIMVGRVVTTVVRAGRTIVAGCSFATTLLRLALIRVLDLAVQRWPPPCLHYAVVVDDIQLQGIGPDAAKVTSAIQGATGFLIDLLTVECKLVVSMKKFQVLTNSKESAEVVQRSKLLSRGLRPHARNLGIDFTCGKRARPQVRASRVQKMLKRMPFFRRLRAAGARTAHLARTGINPALLYGVKVGGVSNSELMRMRRMVRSSFQLATAGRSLTLDLVLEGRGTDPAEKAICDPIVSWCVALWDSWLPRGVLLRTLGEAISRVQDHKSPWSVVRGPASALVATLSTIGWKCNNAFQWLTHRGVINVVETPPRAVQQLAKEAVERWQWLQVQRSEPALVDIGPTAVIEPLVKLLHGKMAWAGWTALRRGNLKSVVVRGQWPQCRLFEVGLADTDACQLCGATGTMWHRLYDCPALHMHRQQYGHDRLVASAWRWPDMPLWTRCLLGDPSWLHPEPLTGEMTVWEKQPVGSILEGECYGDGSGLWPQFARLRRCGWGLVCYTRGVGVTAIAHGPLPGLQQDVPLAESFAFLMNLRHASLEVVFYTDCEFVKKTFEAGPEHSSSGWFVYAGVWRQIWRLVDDIGRENVRVFWIPAHTSARAVAEGKITGLQRICNAKADEQAKKGANMHPSDSETAQRTAWAHSVVRQVGRYVGCINALVGHAVPRDTTAKPAKDGSADAGRMPRISIYAPRHVARFIGNRYRCLRCLRSAAVRSVLTQLPCRESGKATAHALRLTSGIVFCATCGSYSSSRLRGLRGSCSKQAAGSRATALRRLLRGLHPKTGARLLSEESERVQQLPGLVGGTARRKHRDAASSAACLPANARCRSCAECQCATCQVLECLGPKVRERDDADDDMSDWGGA